jgi:hypothetical protein
MQEEEIRNTISNAYRAEEREGLRRAVHDGITSANYWRSVSAWIPGGTDSRSNAMLRRRQSPADEMPSKGAQDISSA